MTETELQQIEKSIGSSLPSFYRETLADYPFPSGSFFADQFLLPNNATEVIGYNINF